MSNRPDELEPVLAGLENWAEVRVVAALTQAAQPATAFWLSRLLRLPETEVVALLARLAGAGVLKRVEDERGAELRYALADAPAVGPLPPPGPVPEMSEEPKPLDPSPSAEGRDPRQVAGDVSALYRRLFQRQPSLSWLLRQRRQAMLLGEDFAALLARVQAARPSGNPQAYLEGMLKRLERERSH